MVRDLFISFIEISDKSIGYFDKSWLTSIINLDLSHNFVSANGAGKLINILRESAKYFAIKSIDLSKNNILEEQLNYDGIENKNGKVIKFIF